MVNFFLFILGAIVGSFLGMLTYRLPLGLALTGRSKCTRCKKTIEWRDNIPIFGYFLLGGRCRSCKKPFGIRYPLIELISALSFVVVGYFAQNLWEGFFLIAFTSISLALLVIDLEHKILPDILILLLGVLVFLFILTLPSPQIFTHLLSGFGAFLFFLAIYLLTRGRGMGFGDVKLSFVLGMFLGYPNTILWLFLAFVSGALVGVILLILGRAGFKHELAFGPYLLAAAWVTYFWGNAILNKYAQVAF